MPDERARILAEFIQKNLLGGKRRAIAPDTPLFSDELIDSMGRVLFAAFIEERFGVSVGDDQLRHGDLDTIADILALVDRQR